MHKLLPLLLIFACLVALGEGNCHCACNCEECDPCCAKLGEEAYGVCMILCGRRCDDDEPSDNAEFKQVINASNDEPLYLLRRGSSCGEDVVEVSVYDNPMINKHEWGASYSLDAIHDCPVIHRGHREERVIIALSVTTGLFALGCLVFGMIGILMLRRRHNPYEVVG